MSKSSKERKTTECETQVAKNPFEDDMSEDEPHHTDPLLEKDKDGFGNDIETSTKNKKVKKKTPSMIKGLKKRVSGKKSKTKRDDDEEAERTPLNQEAKTETVITKGTDVEKQQLKSQEQSSKSQSEVKTVPKTPPKSSPDSKVKDEPKTPQKVTTATKGKEKPTSTNPFGDTDDEDEPQRAEIKTPTSMQPRSGINNLLSITEKLRASSEGLCDKASAMPSQTQSLPDRVTQTRPKSASTYVKDEKEKKGKGNLSRKQKLRKSLPWRFKMKKKSKGGNDDGGDQEEGNEDEEKETKRSISKEETIELQKLEETGKPKGRKTENLERLLQTTESIKDKMTDKAEEEENEGSSKKPTSHTWPERKKPGDSIDVVDEGPSPGKSKGRPKGLKSLSWRLKGKKKSPELNSGTEEAVTVHTVSSSPAGASADQRKQNEFKHDNENASRSTPQTSPIATAAPVDTEYPQSRSTTAEDVRMVKAQVGGVKEKVYDNIKLLEERDHRLESLENLAENIQDTAVTFKMVSRKAHNKMRWRLWKWRLILIGGILAAVIIIIIIIVVATLPSGDGNDNEEGQPVVTVVPRNLTSR